MFSQYVKITLLAAAIACTSARLNDVRAAALVQSSSILLLIFLLFVTGS